MAEQDSAEQHLLQHPGDDPEYHQRVEDAARAAEANDIIYADQRRDRDHQRKE